MVGEVAPEMQGLRQGEVLTILEVDHPLILAAVVITPSAVCGRCKTWLAGVTL